MGAEMTQDTDVAALVEQALAYAHEAHSQVGQLRAYTNDPYIVHPKDVVKILSAVTQDPVLLQAGALHDVIEDTLRTHDDLIARFGAAVANLVAQVTNPPKDPGLNRAQNKALVRQHLEQAGVDGHTLKCADIASNIGTGEFSLARLDPKFAATYLPEKTLVLDVLIQAHPAMLELARSRIEEGLAILSEMGIRPRGEQAAWARPANRLNP